MTLFLLSCMLSFDDGIKSVHFARKIVSDTVNHERSSSEKLPEVFNEYLGVFTTLHTYPDYFLRGCIGIPEPVMRLRQALIESARSVTHDPRFPVLSASELDNIVVEVTILSKPEKISFSDPKDILSQIQVGRDGLIIEQGYFKGLLLPQVPVEQQWDSKTFIEQTCVKAGLSHNAWLEEETIIKSFTGQIFSEEKPFGTVKEKTFDES